MLLIRRPALYAKTFGLLVVDSAEFDAKLVHVILQLSNGKDSKTGEWNKPTFADCTAFGAVAKRILNEYKPKDEIWLIAKYYSKQQDGKYYKGFIVREIITEKEIQQANKSVFDDLPF